MTDYTSQIDALYQAIQFRAPPANLLATYNTDLNSGSTLAQVATLIENESYTVNYVDPVIREYQAAFGRAPDQTGLAYWVNQVATNPGALAQLNVTFANSAEFNHIFSANANTPSSPALVLALYENILGRDPTVADPNGLAYWEKQPLDAAQLLQAFAQSAEFQTDTATPITNYLNLEAAGSPPSPKSSLFNVTAAQSFDASGFNGVLDASLLSSPVSGVTIASAPTNGSFLNLAPSVTVTDTYADNNNSSSLTLTHAGSATNSLTINFAGTSAAAASETIATLTSTGDATITISSGGASTNTNFYNAIDTLNETDNHLAKIVITGAQPFVLGDANGVNTNTAGTSTVASSLTLIDGSATTGGLEIKAGATSAHATYAGLTILGGAGGDDITNYAINGVITEGATPSTTSNILSLDSVAVGGIINDQTSAGADAIYLRGIDQTANLGSGGTAGSNTTVLVFDNGGVAATALDTVQFGSGIATVTDNLAYSVAASAASNNANGNLLALTGALHAESLAFTNTIANAAGALGAATVVTAASSLDQAVFLAKSATANTVTWFQYANNTYIEDSGATPATGTAGAEIVKITGAVDLSHAMIANGHLTFA